MKAHCASYKNIMQMKIKAKQNRLMLLSNCTVHGKKNPFINNKELDYFSNISND